VEKTEHLFGERWRTDLAAAVTETMAELGVPGEARVVPGPTRDLRSGQPMALTVGGRHWRFPMQTVHAATEAVLDELVPDHPNPELLSTLLASGQGPEVLRLVALEAVRLRPSVLLGPGSFGQFRNGLRGVDPTVTDRWPAPRLTQVLHSVLDLRISLRDRETVSTVLRDAPDSVLLARERLAAALRPDIIEIHLREAFLRELMDEATATRPDTLNYLRDEVFNELGIWLPPFRLVPDPSLPPRSICVTVNSLPTIPVHGLAPGQASVNATTDRWDPANHLVRIVAAHARRHAWCMLDQRVVSDQCGQLGFAFPALSAATRDLIPIETVTAVLRGLLAEQISVRNLRRILERLIDSTDPFLAPPPETIGGCPDHPAYAYNAEVATLTAYVRSGLAWQLRQQFGWSGGTVHAFLTDADLEMELARSSLDDDGADRILRAIALEVDAYPPGTRLPVILTQPENRAKLQALITNELPLTVLTYNDLPPATMIQPVMRISLSH
jgi:flagellar biosynthesis component FlhA